MARTRKPTARHATRGPATSQLDQAVTWLNAQWPDKTRIAACQNDLAAKYAEADAPATAVKELILAVHGVTTEEYLIAGGTIL